MTLTLITGPANAGKAEHVFGALRRAAAVGDTPWLIVPTAADVRYHRLGLARGGPTLGVRVGRFSELAAELARSARVEGNVIPALAREQVVSALLADSDLDLPDGRAGASFVRELALLIAELQSLRVKPGRLRQAVAAWVQQGRAPGVPTRALAELFGRYLQTLQGLGWVDAELATARALDTLRQSPWLWGAPGPSVCIYGFDDLTELELDAIDTLARAIDARVTVSLTYEAGRIAFSERAGTFETLLPWADEHLVVAPATTYYADAARVALGHVERDLFEGDAAGRGGAVYEPGDAVRLLEGGGERAELELVAAEIRALLDSGFAPGEIALVHRSPEMIADTLAEVFASFAIPLALQRRVPFVQTAVGRGLVALVRCALSDGDARELVQWLRTPGVVRHQRLVDAFEQQVTRDGVRAAAAARSLWESQHWPLSALDRMTAAAAHGAVALIDCVQAELWRLFVRPRLSAATELAGSERHEAWAVAGAVAMLDQLSELAQGMGAAAHPAHAQQLVTALESLVLAQPPPVAADAIAVVDPLALRARRVRALFLCCLQEGVFPKHAAAPPFLSEQDRRGLAETSGLVLRRQRDHLARERYLLYACVSRPEQLLVLSWHTADDEGKSIARSLFVDDVCDLFDGSLLQGRRHRSLGAVDVPPSDHAAADGGHADGHTRLVAPLQPLSDGRLLGDLAGERPWSASALESYAACPARWFVERVLRPDALDPEAEPLAAGTVIHAVLKDVLDGLRERTGVGLPTPATLSQAIALVDASLQNHCEHSLLANDPARHALARRHMQADLEGLMEHMASQPATFLPTHLELGFGFGESEDERSLPTFQLGGGVQIRGRIDRIDVSDDGRALVYDYKRRGRASSMPAAKWLSASSFQVALYMRACRDLLGLDTVGGFYQPVVGADLRARGVVAEEARALGMRTDVLARDEMEQLVEAACGQAREAASQARAGQVQGRPRTCPVSGKGCMYKAICRWQDA
jgi:ATP-dependent helicase/DNAse subunit B